MSARVSNHFAFIICLAVALILLLVSSGCVCGGNAVTVVDVRPLRSPQPEEAPLSAAWQMAESYAATRQNSEALFGCGESMAPLYPHHTIIVVEKQPLEMLEPGMTVVFLNDRKHRVAHTLIAKTDRGWSVAGLANGFLDPVLVTGENYVGTITRAWRPTYASSH